MCHPREGIPASRALEWRFAGCLRPNAAQVKKPFHSRILLKVEKFKLEFH
jgi:hypothetical protein